jgi:beta-phosphoglucomutase-like phosphatase (HAD superfamily)
MTYLAAVRVLLVDFAEHALKLTEQLKDASLLLARQSGRPVRYLASAASNKEKIARRIAAADNIDQKPAPAKAGG